MADSSPLNGINGTSRIPTQFSVTAQVYSYKAETGGQLERTPEARLGPFVFRRPTRRDEHDISLRVDADMARLPNRDAVSASTFYRVMFEATIPHLLVEGPEHLDWEYLSFAQIEAIYLAYQEGLDKLIHGEAESLGESQTAESMDG
jgi:hypothetical protein